jgi:hypothetical protein
MNVLNQRKVVSLLVLTAPLAFGWRIARSEPMSMPGAPTAGSNPSGTQAKVPAQHVHAGQGLGAATPPAGPAGDPHDGKGLPSPASAGGATTKYPDGRAVTVAPDGTTTTVFSSGRSVAIMPDGCTVTGSPDGTRIITHADGSSTRTTPDGHVHKMPASTARKPAMGPGMKEKMKPPMGGGMENEMGPGMGMEGKMGGMGMGPGMAGAKKKTSKMPMPDQPMAAPVQVAPQPPPSDPGMGHM